MQTSVDMLLNCYLYKVGFFFFSKELVIGKAKQCPELNTFQEMPYAMAIKEHKAKNYIVALTKNPNILAYIWTY